MVIYDIRTHLISRSDDLTTAIISNSNKISQLKL